MKDPKEPVFSLKVIFNKEGSEDFLLSDHLRIGEVSCNCRYRDCVSNMLALSVIKSFRELRKAYGLPIYINSGYRCQKHNEDILGVDDSKHKLGLALDLRCKNSKDLAKLKKLARRYFDFVISYPSFIHCHNLGDREERESYDGIN